MPAIERDIYELERRYRDLAGRWLTIGTAESASGGRIGDRLTDIAGSSDYFQGGIVSYSNQIKSSLLGVRPETLSERGAVSQETAVQMAQGARRVLGVDVAVSDTGIAGPGGSTPDKPVGLFYLGLAWEGGSRAQLYVFSGDRAANKEAASEAALKLLRGRLVEELRRLDAGIFRETRVVTCFLEHDGKVLIVRRSQKVGSFRGSWSGISGYMEKSPDEQALTEIREEAGLGRELLVMTRKGEAMEMVDVPGGRCWMVHPYLFHVTLPGKIKLDWENTEMRWVLPGQLKRYRTVPGLAEALQSVWKKA
jgi:nicotinamide-nucleotide amidase